MRLRQRRIARVLVVGAVFLGLLVVAPTAAFATQYGVAQVGSYAATNNSYGGHAEAGWVWSGRASVTQLNVDVQDTVCDSDPVYVYFTVYNNGSSFKTSTDRYDRAGCHGNGTTYSGLSISSNFNIISIAITICIDEFPTDSCKTGPKSAVNPIS